jgi:outer membrane receptor for ferrienterochelin and colicin
MEILFSKKINWNVGGKSTLNFFKNVNSQTTDPTRQMNFAAYLEGAYKITNKLIVNLGARYENFLLTDWLDIDNHYKDLFLDGNINYKFDNKTTLSFLVGKRTQRPSYSNLLPIESYTSSNVASVGNPNLNREMSYNYEIGFSKYINEQFVKISSFYKHTNNKISNYISVVKNTFYTNHINIDSENDFGISLWASMNFFQKRLNLNYGFDAIQKSLTHNKLEKKGIRYLNNLNLIYKIRDDFYVNFFGAFNTANIYLQGKENAYTYSNFSLQKNFCEGNLRVAVSLDNPFSKGITLKQNYLIEKYAYNNQLTYYNRGIRLFVIYKFGKKQPDSMMKMQDDILKEQNNSK